jgi:hypothetical protein
MQSHRNNSAKSFTVGGNFSLAWIATAILFALLICSPLNAEIVDRVVANVNGHALLQSDWEQEIAFEGFSDARDPNSFSRDERSAALDRLIDQELLREQLRPAQAAPLEQVASRVAAIRKLHPNCETEAGWQSTLQRYGFTQGSIEKRIGDQILLMKLVDDRLRPSVQIDQQAVEAYYQEQLVPEMQKSGSVATPLPEVSGKIRALLAEKKLNELLTGWLASLRSTSRIMSFEAGYGERSR